MLHSSGGVKRKDGPVAYPWVFGVWGSLILSLMAEDRAIWWASRPGFPVRHSRDGAAELQFPTAWCPRRHFCVWVLGFIGTASPRCHLLQQLQRIGILTHQQHQRRLRIRLGPLLLPLL